tara:strand:- start:9947 stop:10273 length:327 start_codon:yes stop_codon:yes gene_type:complete
VDYPPILNCNLFAGEVGKKVAAGLVLEQNQSHAILTNMKTLIIILTIALCSCGDKKPTKWDEAKSELDYRMDNRKGYYGSSKPLNSEQIISIIRESVEAREEKDNYWE